MTAPDLILGLDGGGTKTVLAVADRDGAVVLAKRCAALDPLAHPEWPAVLESVLREAGPSWTNGADPTHAAAVLALPVHGEIDTLSRDQERVAARLLPMRHAVVNDVRAAFDGALAGQAGVLVLAGTGSMAWAGDGRGAEHRVGGWGDAFGDEGSAHWIGREALSAATRALDGRSGDVGFAEALLARLGLGRDDLIGWCYAQASRRSAIAGVARLVDAMARAGSPEAEALLARAGDHLGDHALAALSRVDLPSDAPWTYAGGVFASPSVRRRMTQRLGQPPHPPRLPPVGGALLRAARLGGWSADDRWIDRLAFALSVAVPPENDVSTRHKGSST